jgi:hypothetical protein
MGMHKMQQTAAATKQPERPQSWPKGVSGNPSGIRVSHHALNLYREIAAELGGEAALSVIDRTLLLQATRLLVRSARLKDHDAAIRMSSEARRTLEGLRRHVARVSAPAESFTDIAVRAQAEASERRAIELAADAASEQTTEASSELAGEVSSVPAGGVALADEDAIAADGKPGAVPSKESEASK